MISDVDDNAILVTFLMPKSVTNILRLSSTQIISNIRHQHRDDDIASIVDDDIA